MSAALSVRHLRLNSHLAEAMKVASEALGKSPGDFELMAETIRVLILARETAAASGLYQAFTAANERNNLEPEALVRMALLMGRGDLIENMEPPGGPSWLVSLLTEGSDPEGSFEPELVDVKVLNGPAIFNFTGPCPHCRHSLGAQVKISLLVHRNWLCPSCFGNVQLDHQGARNSLIPIFPDLIQMNGGQSDANLIDYLRPKLMGVEPMPEIAMKLGQEYHFLMNEIILAHLNSEATTNGATE